MGISMGIKSIDVRDAGLTVDFPKKFRIEKYIRNEDQLQQAELLD